MHACYLWRPEKGLDPLELESQIFVGLHVGAGNGIHSCVRISALNAESSPGPGVGSLTKRHFNFLWYIFLSRTLL